MKILNTLPEDVNHNNSAILAIDLQNMFCNPTQNGNHYTEFVSEKMELLRPVFNNLAIPIIWIRMMPPSLDPKREELSFFTVKPNPTKDIFIEKEGQSGFESTDLLDVLEKRSIKHLFGCGVSLPHCIKDTLLHEQAKKFQRYFVHDVCAEINFFGVTPPHPVKRFSELSSNPSDKDINDTSIVSSIVSSRVLLEHFSCPYPKNTVNSAPPMLRVNS